MYGKQNLSHVYHFWVIHSVTKLMCSFPSQNFCQELAKELSCHSYWTDMGILTAGVGFAAAVVAAIGYLMLSGGETKDSKKCMMELGWQS